MERKISSWDHHLKEWNGKFQAQVIFRGIFANFLNLECYLIPADNLGSWQVIHAFEEKLFAVDYETIPSVVNKRFQYNTRAFHKALKTQKPHYSAHMGSYGLFVPIVENGKSTALLQTGVFLKDIPTEQELVENWKKLRGTYPKAHDNDFLKYVRIFLEAPIFDPKHLEKLQSAMEWYGALLIGQRDWKEVLEYFRECTRYFAIEFGHRNWIRNVLIERKFFRSASYARELMDWEREELGLTRFPTSVFAIKLKGSGKELSDLLSARELQKVMLQIARQTDELFSGPLGHYGVLALTSCPEEDPPSKQKEELRSIAHRLAAQIAKLLGNPVFVGIGRRTHRDVDLKAAYNEAVTALFLAESQNRQVLFFDEYQGKNSPVDSLRRLPRHFVDSLREKGSRDLHLFREKYVETVLKESYQRPDAVRRTFMEAIHRIAELIEEGGGVEASTLSPLEQDAESGLESAPSLNEMIDRFGRAVDQMAPLLDRPYNAEKRIRLQKAQEALEAHPEAHWTLPLIARRYGFSTPAFSKEFSGFAGSAFSEYLLERRIEKAKRLLSEGTLPLSNVSDACGFSSLNYFFQAFKRRVGQSPGEYRRITKY